MNRQDLIDAIAEDTEASKAATTRFLDSLITIVQNEVAKGGAVMVSPMATPPIALANSMIGRGHAMPRQSNVRAITCPLGRAVLELGRLRRLPNRVPAPWWSHA